MEAEDQDIERRLEQEAFDRELSKFLDEVAGSKASTGPVWVSV
jgi:hypothetical protein